MNRRLVAAVGILSLLGLLGALGYRVLEGLSWTDALYMTVITLSTVGFGEVQSLSPAGRLFTMGLIVVGFGTATYTATILAQSLLDARLARLMGIRRMNREIRKMENHIIVVGYGRVGQMICQEFQKRGADFIVVEHKAQAAGVPTELLVVEGDATEDEVLHSAGITRAHSLVCTLSDEAAAVYVTLSARQLNPDIFITTRADAPQLEGKLKRAGANRVICPYRAGAQRMAVSTLRPHVIDFMNVMLGTEASGIEFQEVRVASKSPLVGKTLRELDLRQRFDLMVVGVKHPDSHTLMGPAVNEPIRAQDILILIGSAEGFSQLSQWMAAQES